MRIDDCRQLLSRLAAARGRQGNRHSWHDDFLILGNSGWDKKKVGTLSYRSANGQTLFDVTLGGVGITALRPVPDTGGYEATLFVERMSITSAFSCPQR